MSNFPIIATTPPPLDVIDSEEEDEPDFRNFNYVNSPEEEKDIEFVVPDFSPDKETDGQTSSDLKIEVNENVNHLDIKCDKQLDNNCCDNDFDLQTKTLSEKDFEIVKSVDEFQTTIDYPNDEQFVSNENHFKDIVFDDKTIEKSTEDIETVVTQEINDFDDDNDLEFADFTSCKFTELEDKCNQNNDILEDNTIDSLDNNCDNSFSDFIDSNQTNFDAINDSKHNEIDFNDNQSDDDFADFASAQPVVNNNFESVSDFKTNFSETIESDDNEEFADFASFQECPDNGFIDNSTIGSNLTALEESNKFKELFAQVFPTEQTVDSIENSPDISRDLFNTAEQNSKTLWKQLQDLESAPSLKLRWPTSHSFQLLLTALNIDPRNILRNPSVPVFASGLGCVLEPTKHNINSDLNDEIESEITNTNGLTSNTIPPVHFDWSSSGLTNPLDANQKSMVAFDLDFFVTNDDVKNNHKQTGISNIEEEFLNNKSDNNLVLDSDTNQNNIMQKILSSVGNSSSISLPKTNGSRVLSAEALQVLDELPNLSFMSAKVLMFPLNIKNKSNT